MDCLLQVAHSLDPNLRGEARKEALFRGWTDLQPTLPSSWGALAAKLRRTLHKPVQGSPQGGEQPEGEAPIDVCQVPSGSGDSAPGLVSPDTHLIFVA